MITVHTIAGADYLDADSVSFGDYGGYGSYGLANLRWIEREAESRGLTAEHYSFGEQDELTRDGFATRLMRHAESGAVDWRPAPFGRPDVLFFTGDYGSRSAWVRADSIIADHIRSLDDYPSLDDDLCSEVETQWEDEAWSSWLKFDLVRALPDDLQDAAEGLDDGAAWDAYRAAMDAANEYPIAELSGVYIDVSRIARPFAEQVRALLAA